MQKRAWSLAGFTGALVLSSCAGRAGSDLCALASQHVAECTGESGAAKTCGPATAQALLGMSCDELQSQYNERSAQGRNGDFWCDTFGWCDEGEESCGYGWQKCEHDWEEEYGEGYEQYEDNDSGCRHWHSECCLCGTITHDRCHDDRDEYPYYKDCEDCRWKNRNGGEACDVFGNEDNWIGWDDDEDEEQNEGGCCHMHSKCEHGCPVIQHESCDDEDKHQWPWYKTCGEEDFHEV